MSLHVNEADSSLGHSQCASTFGTTGKVYAIMFADVGESDHRPSSSKCCSDMCCKKKFRPQYSPARYFEARSAFAVDAACQFSTAADPAALHWKLSGAR